MIEFNTNLASPPDNGYLSVVSVQTTSALTTIAQGISLIATPGTATVTDYGAAVADYYDAEDAATAGHFTSFPFGDSAAAQTALDHDFAVQVQGAIQVPAAGTYTFDVTSSDGFQLSIGTQTFTGSSTGTTYGGTMAYSGTRTIADSLGVTTFAAAGTYPIDLYYFNGATDAPRLEFSAAAGTQTSFGSSFHLIGDTTNGGLSVANNFGYIAPPFTVTVNSQATNNTSPALTGTISDPAASVTVRVNGSSYAASNNGDGTWSLPQGDISAALASGTYNVVASGVNTSGIAAFAPTVNQFAVNTTGPTVSITSPASPTVSTVNSIAIVFSEPVQNFSLQNLQLTLAGYPPAGGGPAASEPLESATLTSTDSQNWTLGNLAGLTTAPGIYVLTLVGLGSTITDLAGNPLLTGATTTWTRLNPLVQSINTTGQTITNASSVQYAVTFNTNVTNVLAADFTLATSGAAGTIGTVTGSGSTYTVTVKNVSGNGTLGLNLVDNNSIVDQNNNPLGGVGVGDGNFTGQLYTIDTLAPTIAIGTPSASYAAGGPITYTVTYADANFNTSTLAAGNVTLNKTGTATGTIAVSGTGLTRTVTVSGITGNGSLGISIAAGTASDLAGNLAPTAGPSTTFIVDNTAPTISIGSPSVAYAAGGPITYTVTYADANFNASTLAAGNVTLNKTGTATGTIAVSGTGLTRTVTVSSISGNGSLGISIAAGTASDLAGNMAPAAGPSTTFIVDNTAPTISIASPSGSYAAGGPITYTVTYADANFNTSTLAAGNVTLNKTGTAAGTIAVSGTGLTRTVTISSISGNGSLGISIAAGTASDLAGNLAPAAGPSTTFIVDNTAPTISLGAPSATLTASGPVTYTVTYADANFNTSTLVAGNITLNKTGTASGTVGVAGSGLTYTVTISSITGNGTLGVSIAAGTASDLAGNLAPAAGPSTTFAVDNSPPTVATPASATPNSVTGTTTALAVLGADSAMGEASLTYTWAATVLPNGAAVPVFSINASNTAKNTTATFSKAGSYTFQATITDVDGLSANSTVNVTVNQTLAGVSVSPPIANITAAGTQQFTVASVDQFGNPMSSQPAWTWSLIGEGSLSAGGLYLPPYATGAATVQATSGTLTGTATVNFAGQAVWSSAVNSSWNTAGNWRDSITGNVIAAPGGRGIAGDTVVFNSSAGGTVTLDGASPSLAGITFSGGNSSIIAQGSGGTLDLNNGAQRRQHYGRRRDSR